MVANVKARAAGAAREAVMACGGCGKGRAGTAAVKDRKREAAATPPADRVSTTTGSVNPKNTRYAEYLRALRNRGTNQG